MTEPILPDLMSDLSLLRAMVRVEAAWIDALVEADLVPAVDEASAQVLGLVSDADLESIVLGAESPVEPLVDLLRSRSDGDLATWLHHGLAGQDVLDTALVLTVRDVLDHVIGEIKTQVATLSGLAESNAASPLGAVVTGWLDGVIDASDLVLDARALLPVQLGGTSGTLAATTALADERGHDDPLSTAAELLTDVAEALDLRERRPWHASRGSVTRTADALLACTDAWGALASHPAVSGDSLAASIHSAALTTPSLGTTLHLASASGAGEGPGDTWRTEWPALRDLAGLAVVAASRTSELLTGIDTTREDVGTTPLGITEDLVAEVLERARIFLEENE